MPIASVQTGEFEISGNPHNLTIASVDTAKTFVVATWLLAGGWTTRRWCTVDLTSSTNIEFDTNSSPLSGTMVRWWAIEFDDSDFSVQRGEKTGNYTSSNETLSAVSLTRSVAMATMRGNTSQQDSENVARAEITTTTNLLLEKQGNINQSTMWQVIEWPSAVSVQGVASDIASSGTSKDNTITAVVIAQSILWSTGTPTANIVALGEWATTDELTTTTNLQSRRGDSNTTVIENFCYISEHPAAELVVQRGIITLGNTDLSDTATLTAIDTALSATWGSCSGREIGESTDNPNAENCSIQQEITNSTTLTVERHSAASTATVNMPWQVMEFIVPPPAGVPESVFPDILAVDPDVASYGQGW